MHMLSRRLQILLDEERYDRLARAARARRRSIGSLVREALDRAYPEREPKRSAAAERILHAEPMAVPDEPLDVKREVLDARDRR
jgi:hypothetical protein